MRPIAELVVRTVGERVRFRGARPYGVHGEWSSVFGPGSSAGGVGQGPSTEGGGHGSRPDTTPDREFSSGGDFAAGLGPTHYGSGPLPLQAGEDLVIESNSSTAHLLTQYFRGGQAVSSSTRVLAANGSIGPLRGRGLQSVEIDEADSSVYWTKGPAGTVWPTNPSVAAGGGLASSSQIDSSTNITITSALFAANNPCMLGAGGVWAFTPKKTGIVLVTLRWTPAYGGAAVQQLLAQLKYGTGSAPATGAAPTGSSYAAEFYGVTTYPEGLNSASTMAFLFTNLTAGDVYWFDYSVTNVTGNTGPISFQPIAATFVEQLA
jgi:hypothetical protein